MYKTVVRPAMMIGGQWKGVQDCCKTSNDDSGGQWKGVQDCCKTSNDDSGVNGKVYKTVVRLAMMIVGSMERCTRLL